METALANSIADFTAVLGILESGMTGVSLRAAKAQARLSLTTLILSANGDDADGASDELKQVLVDANCPLKDW
jgi:hypothetical protein